MKPETLQEELGTLRLMLQPGESDTGEEEMQTKRKALESGGEDQKKGQGFVSSVGSWDKEGGETTRETELSACHVSLTPALSPLQSDAGNLV
jgi:hypothetical protein